MNFIRLRYANYSEHSLSTHYFRFAADAAGAERRRAPLLERLLARAEPSRVTDWRPDAYHAIAPGAAMPPVAGVALHAACGTVEKPWTCIATPVHYIAEMSNVRMAPDGVLSLSDAQATAIAEDFNRVWHDAGLQLKAGRGGVLFCLSDLVLEAATCDPQQVLGRYLETYLPDGRDAGRLRRLMSEVEMWMFDHPANRARIADGAAAVSGLWLWGGGATLSAAPEVRGWTAGDDPFFGALPGHGATAPLTAQQSAASGVAVLPQTPGTDAWSRAETEWLSASLGHLRAGRITALVLSSGERRFDVSARGARRFWRGARPWWDTLALGGSP